MTTTKPAASLISLHRPTALCAVGILGAVWVVLGFEWEAQAWCAAVIAAAAMGLCLFLPQCRARMLLLPLLAGMLAGSVAVDVQERQVRRELAPYLNHSYRYTVSGLTAREGEVFDERTRVLLRVDSLDGEAVDFYTYVYLDGAGELAPGMRVTARMRFEQPARDGEFDALHYYRSRGVYLMGKAAREVRITREEAVPLWLRPTLWARALTARLYELTGERHADLLRAQLFGDTSRITPEYEKALRRCGLSHIMAMSGMNVAFLVNFCVLLLRRRWGSFLAVPVVVAFTLMVGAEASVVRAALMQLIFLGAYAVRRENDSLNALAVALGLMLLFNPWYLYDAGMWLSFASTLGLLLVGLRMRRTLEKPFQKLPKPLRRVTALFTGSLSATLATMAFVLPLQLYYFRSFSLIAPLANMLLLWAVEGAFIPGMLGLGLSYLWMPLGKVCLAITVPLLEVQLWLAPILAKLPFSLIPSGAYTLIGVGIVYAFLLLHILCRAKHARRASVTFAALCIGAVVLCAELDRLNTLTVASLDTRGGQATVVYDGRRCLVLNCGGAQSAEAVVEYLESQGIGRIEALLLTDEKQGSVSGCAELARELPVERLLYAPSAAEKAAGIAAGQYMPVTADTRLEAAGFTLRLHAADGEGFDAGRLSASLETPSLRFLLTGSIAPEDVPGEGRFDVVLASDYYVNHTLPAELLHEGTLWILPSWGGIGAEARVQVEEQGGVAVDLHEVGDVVFTLR